MDYDNDYFINYMDLIQSLKTNGKGEMWLFYDNEEVLLRAQIIDTYIDIKIDEWGLSFVIDVPEEYDVEKFRDKILSNLQNPCK